MAAVDAIWRTHISGQALCSNEGGTYKLFWTLHPRDFTKLSNNPGYCMLNDGITHLIKAHVMVCWEQAVGNSDLQDFADTELMWDTIEDLAHQIFDEHFSGDKLNDFRELRAVGLMKDLLWIWVPMFRTCGKHKYAVHISKFL